MRYVCFTVLYALLVGGSVECQTDYDQSNKYEVRGTVVDFSGRPWLGAAIKLKSRSSHLADGGSEINRETKSDAKGSYAFTGLPAGSFEVFIESVTPALREIKEVNLYGKDFAFELNFGFEIGSIGECPLHFVQGRVTLSSTKKSVEGANVSVVNAFNQRKVLASKTDKSGNYLIGICNPGQYIVFVNTPNYKVEARTVTFLPKAVPQSVNFSLIPNK